MSHPLGTRLTGLLAASLLTLTACGDGDDDRDDREEPESRPSASSTSDATDTGSADPSASSTAAPGTGDQAIADAALLVLEDFPAGWTAVPADDDADDDEAEKQEVADCAGVAYEDLYHPTSPHATSPDFTAEDDTEVSVKVIVDPSEEWVSDAFEIAAGDTYRECITAQAGASIEDSVAESGEDFELGEFDISPLQVGSYGDQTLAFRMTIPVASDGVRFEVGGDVVLVRVGRAQTQISTFGVDTRVPIDDLQKYVGLATQRLESALAAAP